MLKTALGYLAGGAAVTRDENDFIGQIITLGVFKLKVMKIIAEGGYGLVYLTEELGTGANFALKRMFSVDEESDDAIRQEIQVLELLDGHPHVIRFQGSRRISDQKGKNEYLILTEFCSGGVIADAFRSTIMSESQILKTFYQCCQAVSHLHKQNPPLIHRDLKAENLLIANDGTVKLCDFGSSTTARHEIDETWSSLKRSLVLDEVWRNTTPAFRPPECVDTYLNFVIDHRMDLWALGCLLFYLCHKQHPFAEGSTLAILNGKYIVPRDSVWKDTVVQTLIEKLLSVNPEERPSIEEVLGILDSIGRDRNIKLDGPAFLPSSPASCSRDDSMQRTATQSEPNNLMSSLRGGAGNFLKKIGDTSSKVIQIAQLSLGKGEPDINYITSRIAVMSYPAEGLESAYRNHLEDVRTLLSANHPDNYMVVNVSGRSYTSNKFPGVKVVEKNWNPNRTPPIVEALELSHTVYAYLSGKQNIAVIHCMDGKRVSAFVVVVLLLYCRIFNKAEDALRLFSARRCAVSLSPSQSRYLKCIEEIIRTKHSESRALTIERIVLSNVPLFSKLRDGCRPFVNIYVGEDCVFSTCLEYDKLPFYGSEMPQVVFEIPKIEVAGDVTVTLSHARTSTFAKGRIQAIPMTQLQFFTGSIKPPPLKYNLCDLDLIEEPDRYQAGFSIEITASASRGESLAKHGGDILTKFFDIAVTAKTLFSSNDEMQSIIDEFKSEDRAPPSRPPPPLPTVNPEPPTMSIEEGFLDQVNNVETHDLLNLGLPSVDQPLNEDVFGNMPKVQPVDQISVNDLLGFNSDAQVINDELAGADSGYQGLRVDSILSQDTSLKEAETDVFVDDWSCFMNHKNGRSISNTEPEDPFENCAVAGNAHVSPQNKKKAPDEFFDDLLGSQGFTSFVSKKHIPRTMAEMKRSGIEREMDPTQLKVYDWKTGKERNIRALLCSLHTIVWSDAKWTEVGMHQLIGVSDVKKIYRKACLAVHPDKLSGTDKEELAKAIFMELNDAWSEFEKKQGLA